MTASRRIALGLVLALWSVAPSAAQPEVEGGAASMSAEIGYARGLSRAFNHVSETLAPSVVFVQRQDVRRVGQRIDFFGRVRDPGREQLENTGVGSGVIVDASGLILTNNHVIEDAEAVGVQLTDGRTFTAVVLGSDPETDIAVLKIDGAGLTPAKLGDSDAMQVGDWVLAMGSPFGLSNTVTAGIVSATGRQGVFARGREQTDGGVRYEEFIQTDAAVNPGNSGGPLVNLDGEVIGINTAIFSRSGGNIGLSFAVPTAIAERVLRSIVEDGRVARGWLGVTFEDLSPEDGAFMGFAKGVLVTSVLPDSPAAGAGLRPGDIITAADGRPALSSSRLVNTIALSGPGREIGLEYRRDGAERTTKAVLTEYESYLREQLSPRPIKELNLEVVELTRTTRAILGLADDLDGVYILSMDPSGAGVRVGLRPRDILTRAGEQGLENARDLTRALDGIRRGEALELHVQRGARRGTVTISKE
jgi:serine protease Do